MFEHLFAYLKGKPLTKLYVLYLNGLAKISFSSEQLQMFNSLFQKHQNLNIRKTDMIERVSGPQRLLLDVKQDKRFLIFKSYAQSLQFNTELLHKVSSISHLVPPNTLGVHIRLTDMNRIHPQYGILSYDDYLHKIQDMVTSYRNTNNYF